MKKMNDDFNTLIAHVELAKARFSHGEDLGIEFLNEIDAWTKMEVTFREQIKLLKECRPEIAEQLRQRKKNKNDLRSVFYSVREKID